MCPLISLSLARADQLYTTEAARIDRTSAKPRIFCSVCVHKQLPFRLAQKLHQQHSSALNASQMAMYREGTKQSHCPRKTCTLDDQTWLATAKAPASRQSLAFEETIRLHHKKQVLTDSSNHPSLQSDSPLGFLCS